APSQIRVSARTTSTSFFLRNRVTMAPGVNVTLTVTLGASAQLHISGRRNSHRFECDAGGKSETVEPRPACYDPGRSWCDSKISPLGSRASRYPYSALPGIHRRANQSSFAKHSSLSSSWDIEFRRRLAWTIRRLRHYESSRFRNELGPRHHRQARGSAILLAQAGINDKLHRCYY